MSKGSNTTTTSQTPTALPAYQGAIDQLQSVAATPYTPYSGELTAPINQQQQQGVGAINQYAASAVPYLQGAESTIQGAAQPLTQAQIQQYQSPYTQDVVNATEAQFNNQNAQQQQQVLGNAAAQGALGGDRTAVAQSVLAGQQQAQEAPVIAGLENQGYTQALQTAGQQFQQNPEQAAYGEASTGTALENAGLTGANAQFGAGTAEQQTQQAQDTAAYQQAMMAQFMPESMLSWELPLLTGVGSQEGGTSSTTGPAPNPLAQYLGLGIAGLGAAGQAGGSGGIAALSDRRAKENIKRIGHLNDGQHIYRFNYKGDPQTRIGLMAQDVEKVNPDAVREIDGLKHVDYDEATEDSVRRFFGGRVQGLADGGVPSGMGFSPGLPGNPFLPSSQMPRGPGAPAPPKVSGQQVQTAQQMVQNANSLAGAMKKAVGTPDNPVYGGGNALTDEFGGSSSAPLEGLDASDYGVGFRQGGRIYMKRGGAPVRAGLGMASFMPRRGYDSGGVASDDGDVINFPSDRFVQPPVPAGLYNNSAGEANPLENILKFQTYGQSSPYAPTPSAAETPRTAANDELPPEITQGASAPQAGVGSAMAFAPGDTGPAPVAPAAGVGSRETGSSDTPDSVNAMHERADARKGLAGLSPDFYQSLMSAGLGMMASRSPFLGTAVGEGGLQGLSTYSGLKKQEQDVDLKVKQLDQAAKAESDRIALETKKESDTYSRMTPAQQAEVDFRNRNLERENLQPVKVGQDIMGRDVLGVRAPNGGFLDPLTMKPIDPSRISSTAASAAPGTGTPSETATQPKIGPLPPRDEGMAQQIAHYEIPPPSGFALAKPNSPAPMWLARADEISRAENNGEPYDSTQFGMRNKAVKDFGTGPLGQKVTFFNNAVQHFGTMDGLITAMGSGDVQLINRAKQAFQNQFGYEAPGNFDAAKNIVGQEIVKAIVANGGGEAERQAAAATLAAAKSPEQLRGILNTYRELAGAQLRDLKVQYENTTGLHNFEKKLIPESQVELAKIEARAKANNAQQPPAGTPVARTPEDQQALAWAAANPSDPRAAQIRQRLGVQ